MSREGLGRRDLGPASGQTRQFLPNLPSQCGCLFLVYVYYIVIAFYFYLVWVFVLHDLDLESWQTSKIHNIHLISMQ